tara:strand:+ start:103 stop:219 length:117 start_codon:yes stop_codon:yes gene_type:complete
MILVEINWEFGDIEKMAKKINSVSKGRFKYIGRFNKKG